jgi:hypothetical protein
MRGTKTLAGPTGWDGPQSMAIGGNTTRDNQRETYCLLAGAEKMGTDVDVGQLTVGGG